MAQKVESKAYGLMLDKLLDHHVKEVSVQEIDSHHVLFLDAREKKEFQVSKIPEAIWVGYDDFNFSRVKNIPKDQPIIVYCSVGYRSEKITKRLMEKGFTNVSNLYGGIFEWKNQNKIVLGPDGKPTEAVHAYDKVWGVWLNKGKKVF